MIYLDHAATTRPYDGVLQVMTKASQEGYYNPSSLYAQAMIGTAMIKKTKDIILQKFQGSAKHRVVFTSGGTESDNLAIVGTAMALRNRKGHFLYSAVEHPAVVQAMRTIQAMGHDIQEIPVDATGMVQVETMTSLLRPETAMVSVMHVNNEIGTVQPVEVLAEALKRHNPKALFHCDGVQAFMKVPVNLQNIDFYALSAHKIHGPRGVGALILGVDARPLPMICGGGQQQGLRAGTEDTPGIAGLCEAIQSTTVGSMHTTNLKLRLYHEICHRIPEAICNGPDPAYSAPHILNMSFPVKGEVLLHALEGEGILVSTGSACSSHKKERSRTLTAMGIPVERIDQAIRFSLSTTNTEQEIDDTIEVLVRLVQAYKGFRRKT